MVKSHLAGSAGSLICPVLSPGSATSAACLESVDCRGKRQAFRIKRRCFGVNRHSLSRRLVRRGLTERAQKFLATLWRQHDDQHMSCAEQDISFRIEEKLLTILECHYHAGRAAFAQLANAAQAVMFIQVNFLQADFLLRAQHFVEKSHHVRANH